MTIKIYRKVFSFNYFFSQMHKFFLQCKTNLSGILSKVFCDSKYLSIVHLINASNVKQIRFHEHKMVPYQKPTCMQKYYVLHLQFSCFHRVYLGPFWPVRHEGWGQDGVGIRSSCPRGCRRGIWVDIHTLKD